MPVRPVALWELAIVGLLAAVGCHRGVQPQERVSAVGREAKAAPPPPAPSSFDLVFPVGYGLSRVAIAASQDVALGPRDQVLAIDGSPGTVTNAGSGTVAAGPGTSTGNVVSTGNIVLQPNVSATAAQSAGTVTLHPGDAVGTVAQQATLTPLAHRTVKVPALPGTPAEFQAAPGSSSLAPGLYDRVTIPAGANVTLSAGNYVMNSFTLSTNGQMSLDTSQGTVSVFVKNTAAWNGQVAGDGTRFVFAYLGTASLTFAGSFTGTALVPNTTLALGPHPSSYSGVFYGQHVSVGPGVTVQEIATPLLAASVSVSKTTLCVGEETEVQFDASDAGPGATTQINGIPGSHQFVQFDGVPGHRLIIASVITPDGRADFTEVPVTTQACTSTPGTLPPIALHFWPTPNQPNEVELMVHDFDANGLEVLPSGPATYAWSFGDGQSATTASPLIAHDYTSSVNPLLPYSYFTASVTVTTSGGSVSAEKVIPIWSIYAANRAKGVVQPPSSVVPSGDNLVLNVTNYEPTPLSITAARVDLLPCDPALDPLPQASMPLAVTVPASSTSAVTIPQPNAFSPSICAVGAHLMGSASAGKVYSDTYARVKENALTKQAVTDSSSIAILNQASAFTADPNHFDFRELRQLQARGILTQLPAPVTAGATYSNPGDECTPGDTQPGLDCQPTTDWVVVPGELLNAFKGDVVVHHACGDMIANLLASIHQNYSHSMVVSKNRVEVRHSTASEDRMTNSVNALSLMLDPQKLQFGFPGTDGLMPFTVDQMVNGYCVPDPDGSGGSDPACPGGWHLTGSLHPNPMQCASDLPIVYPLVVRPPPDATTAQLQAVTPVGDQALSISGHYRFFMYSRADEFAPATSGPSWAVGTEESVCSLFALESTRHAGSGGTPVPLAGGGPNDGMRAYSVDERTIAGNNLFTQVFNQVEGELPSGWGSLLNFLTGGVTQDYLDGLALSVGNQICNCFANDGCGDNSGAWQNIAAGMAVSPDDIVNVWQPPPAGTYGYHEPLAYTPAAFRHKYAWVTKSGDASMTVKVVDGDNNPFANATVILNSTPVGTTDSSGTLQIASLDQGSYDVEAQAFLTPQTPPTPPPPPTLSPSAILALPACVSAPLSGFASPCSVTGNNPTCPNLWASECVLGSNSGYASTCACFAPPTPPETCDLAIADRPATVPSSGDVTVELTLCTKCNNGVPESCTQHCASDADCENTQVCNSKGDCAAAPRIVNIQTASDSTFKVEVDNALGGYQNATGPLGFSMTCDPNATSSGGTATQTICETTTVTVGACPVCFTESTSDQETFNVQCQEDETGGIGITVSTSLAEASDCTSSGTVRRTASYTAFIAPSGPSDPTPTASSSFDDCYVSDPESILQQPCDANDVHVTLNFTSEPAP